LLQRDTLQTYHVSMCNAGSGTRYNSRRASRGVMVSAPWQRLARPVSERRAYPRTYEARVPTPTNSGLHATVVEVEMSCY